MPVIEAFRDAEAFYGTLAHETAHYTKHQSRLDRDFGRRSWGDEGYAREELVAELGSASCALIWVSHRKCATTTHLISQTG
jgi:antirestriction protein ArdC